MTSPRPKRDKQVEKINVNVVSGDAPVSPRKQRLTRETVITNDVKQKFTIKYEDIKAHIVEANLLGEGRFGVVWKFNHEPSNTSFAIKRISNNSNGKNGMIMDLDVPIRLGNDCPYIVKFYGALDAESYIWILNEHMDTSLDRFYAKVFNLKLEMPESFLSKVAYSVLSALEFMRSKQLMHRDIKPSNILINSSGKIKVCDFGISGITTNSVNHTYIGSQVYMSPEKINITPDGYSIKADIWSLGISLIEIAMNKHPFAGADYFKVLTTVTSEKDPSPSVDSTLLKNDKERSNCTELMEEPFIKDYADKSIDLEFIGNVINEIKTETSKSN